MAASTEDLDYVRIARDDREELRHRTRERTQSWILGLFTVGRVFLGAVFAGAAIDMLSDYSGTIASLQPSLVDVTGLVAAALCFQLVAGVALIIGLRTRLTACLLSVYLIATLVLIPPDPLSDLGRAVGFSTFGLLSALAMLAAHGAGRVSIDRIVRHRRQRRHRQKQQEQLRKPSAAQA